MNAMNRRRLLATAATAAISPMFGLPTVRALAQATPVASPEADQVPPVISYNDVRVEYAAARNAILTLGRPIVEQLLSDNTGALYTALPPDIRALVSEEDLATFRTTIETNRVHFELPQFGVTFDGHVDGQTIEGFFTQGQVLTFSLSADDAGRSTPIADASPTAEPTLDGRWTGQIATGDPPLDIAVTFRTTDGAMSGTIDIPSQQITALPLELVSFTTDKPLDIRSRELALPHSPANRLYIAQYPWDEAALTVTVVFDATGTIRGFAPTPDWPLPEDPAAEYVSSIAYQLPFNGVWWTAWGGDVAIDNYHVIAPNQRHAYDLVIWKNGGTYQGDGKSNENYWIWGQPVLAPADGTVITVLDGLSENVPGTLAPEPHPAGNHIVLQTAESEFVYLAHLQPGSILVQQGDQVVARSQLALVGNTGNSSEPHLHIHVQSEADFFSPNAIGLPLLFTNYLADGEEVASGVLTRGQFISRQ